MELLPSSAKKKAYEKRHPVEKYIRDGKFTEKGRKLVDANVSQWKQLWNRTKDLDPLDIELAELQLMEAEDDQYKNTLRKAGIDPSHDKAMADIRDEYERYYGNRKMKSLSNKDHARMRELYIQSLRGNADEAVHKEFSDLQTKAITGILNLALKDIPDEIEDDSFAYLYKNISGIG